MLRHFMLCSTRYHIGLTKCILLADKKKKDTGDTTIKHEFTGKNTNEIS